MKIKTKIRFIIHDSDKYKLSNYTVNSYSEN